ncbi:tetratricopeptide repeat protein [Streptomyces sp. NPDC048659]|uniref:tetratricopeptide repeat protein n=1 Tax=Streptomyces sp. NPDC048659 TaxID=3155489 RepID=UPI00343E73B5
MTSPEFQALREAMRDNHTRPEGAERNARAERLLADAERIGEPLAVIEALGHQLQVYNYSSEKAKMFVPFSRLLAMWDRNPGDFDAYETYALHWVFKWVSSGMLDQPHIPLASIEKWLGEMEHRYRLAGHSERAVRQGEFRVARHIGDLDRAGRAYAAWLAAERDDMADCHACELHGQGLWQAELGDDEAALAAWAPVLEGEHSCAHEPHAVLASSLLPLLRLGRAERARANHLRGHRLVRPMESMRGAMALHIEFCALTGNEARALELLAERPAYLTDHGDPDSELDFLAVTALLMDRLVALGLGGQQVPGPADAEPADGWTAAALARHARDGAEALAARFDARNGSDRVSTLVRERMAARPLLGRLPLGVRAAGRPAPVPPAPPEARDPLAEARRLTAERRPEAAAAWAAADRAVAEGRLTPDAKGAAELADHRAMAHPGDPAETAALFRAAAEAYEAAGEPGEAWAARARAAYALGDPDACAEPIARLRALHAVSGDAEARRLTGALLLRARLLGTAEAAEEVLAFGRDGRGEGAEGAPGDALGGTHGAGPAGARDGGPAGTLDRDPADARDEARAGTPADTPHGMHGTGSTGARDEARAGTPADTPHGMHGTGPAGARGGGPADTRGGEPSGPDDSPAGAREAATGDGDPAGPQDDGSAGTLNHDPDARDESPAGAPAHTPHGTHGTGPADAQDGRPSGTLDRDPADARDEAPARAPADTPRGTHGTGPADALAGGPSGAPAHTPHGTPRTAPADAPDESPSGAPDIADRLAEAEWLLGDAAARDGDDEGAAERYERSARLFHEAGLPWYAVEPEARLAALAQRGGDLVTAERAARAALAHGAGDASPAWQARLRLRLAEVLAAAGRFGEAAEQGLEAAHWADEAGEGRGLGAYARHLLGGWLLREGRREEAAVILEAVLPDLSAEEHGDGTVVQTLWWLGDCLSGLAEHRSAAEQWLRAAELAAAWPEQHDHAMLANLAAQALLRAELEQPAEAAFERAGELWLALGDIPAHVRTLRIRAWIAGPDERGRALMATAAEACADDPEGLADTHRQTAELLARAGDPERLREALAYAERAATGYAGAGRTGARLSTDLLTGWIHLDLGEPVPAAALARAVLATASADHREEAATLLARASEPPG